jgi:hypothetical protein
VKLNRAHMEDADDIYETMKMTMGATRECAAIAAFVGKNWDIVFRVSVDSLLGMIKSALTGIVRNFWEWLKSLFLSLLPF